LALATKTKEKKNSRNLSGMIFDFQPKHLPA
jgi:hypothetical protein